MQSWDEFEWDEENERHLARHRVDRFEAEEAATDPQVVVRRAGKDRFGNPRYTYIAKTIDGRVLFLVVDRKGQQRWRVGTGRDATLEEKRSYRRRSR